MIHLGGHPVLLIAGSEKKTSLKSMNLVRFRPTHSESHLFEQPS